MLIQGKPITFLNNPTLALDGGKVELWLYEMEEKGGWIIKWPPAIMYKNYVTSYVNAILFNFPFWLRIPKLIVFSHLEVVSQTH